MDCTSWFLGLKVVEISCFLTYDYFDGKYEFWLPADISQGHYTKKNKKKQNIQDAQVIAHFVGTFILIKLNCIKMLPKEKKNHRNKKTAKNRPFWPPSWLFFENQNIWWIGLVEDAILMEVCGKDRLSDACKALSEGKTHQNQPFWRPSCIFPKSNRLAMYLL